MQVIGLTGGIASGKTTIARYLCSLGAYIIDADQIGRIVVEKGTEGYNKIFSAFGPRFFSPDGQLNRKKLGELVFNNALELEKLNKITYPLIERCIKQILVRLEDEKQTIVVIDAAILIESGWYKMVDQVWLIVIDRPTQIERLMKRNQFSYQEAVSIMNSQLELKEKEKYADRIIYNNDDDNAVFEKIRIYWDELIHFERS